VTWWRDWRRLGGVGLLLAAAVVAAVQRAGRQHIGTDFHVFWQAGYDFAHGLPLYAPLPGARSFIYPPFAAQVFQVLGVLPLQVAAALFYVVSVALVLIAIAVSCRIVQRLEPGSSRPILPLVLAVLLSAVFILDNLVHLQVNLLTFVLCLLGVQALVMGREVLGSGWMVAASAIKVTPVFLVAWAVMRGGRRRLAAVASFVLLCLTLPIAQRGLHQGVLDLTTYYWSFLHQFAAGGVVTNYRNQTIGALVYRATVPHAAGDIPPYEYAYLPSLAPAATLIYQTLALIVLAVFLLHLIRLRANRRPLASLEIASVLLASHLLSGITWKAHLVTMLFVFYAFLSLDRQRLSRPGKALLLVAWAGILVIGLGRDVIGSRLHHYLAGYSIYVWVMLLLFGLSVVWSQKWGENNVSGERRT
jgi:glycosyl transferase family 87